MRRRRALVTLASAALAACEDRSVPARVAGSPHEAPPTPAKPPPAHIEEAPPFSLHVGCWMNLHHFVFGLAASGDRKIPGGAERQKQLEALPAAERRRWAEAVELYAKSYANRDLLFDDGLGELKASLAAQESSETLSLPGASSDLGRILEHLADSYVRGPWIEHSRVDLAFVHRARELIERHGKTIKGKLASLLRTDWPPEPIRVDVCASANRDGAYTSLGPTHTTIASQCEYNAGDYALEVLFHEASHAMIRPIRDAVTAEAARQGVQEPQNLWHGILFYTAGMVIREEIPGHVMYADKFGVWAHGNWGPFRPALARAWQPYVAGKVEFEDALETLIRSLTRPGP